MERKVPSSQSQLERPTTQETHTWNHFVTAPPTLGFKLWLLIAHYAPQISAALQGGVQMP